MSNLSLDLLTDVLYHQLKEWKISVLENSSERVTGSSCLAGKFQLLVLTA